MAIYILIDKGVAPGEALVQSNNATYGYKWTIFGVRFIIGIISMFLTMLFGSIFLNLSLIGLLVMLMVTALIQVFSIGCDTVIYRNLTRE